MKKLNTQVKRVTDLTHSMEIGKARSVPYCHLLFKSGNPNRWCMADTHRKGPFKATDAGRFSESRS